MKIQYQNLAIHDALFIYFSILGPSRSWSWNRRNSFRRFESWSISTNRCRQCPGWFVLRSFESRRFSTSQDKCGGPRWIVLSFTSSIGGWNSQSRIRSCGSRNGSQWLDSILRTRHNFDWNFCPGISVQAERRTTFRHYATYEINSYWINDLKK